MKRVARLCGLIPKPLQRKFRSADENERAALRPVIDAGRERMVRKLAKKGYQLDAVVFDIYGLFTRGPACGKIERVENPTETLIEVN